jgi:hypothetical protein
MTLDLKNKLRAMQLDGNSIMTRAILLWLLGIPIPIILLLALFMR